MSIPQFQLTELGTINGMIAVTTGALNTAKAETKIVPQNIDKLNIILGKLLDHADGILTVPSKDSSLK